MKAQIRFTFLTLALSAFLFNAACAKSSSSDSGSGGSAQGALTLASGSVPTGGTATLTPTGGTPPYQFTLQTSIGGSITPSLDGSFGTLIAGSTVGVVGITVSDKNGLTTQASYTVTAGGLTVTPMSTTIAPGATVSYMVSGGTAPYFYSASAGSFAGAVFTAPSTQQTVTVTVTDSATPTPHTIQATVNVQTGGSVGGGCGGSYNLNLAGYAGTLTIVQDSSGNIGGYLTITGYGGPAAISGTCTNGNINFTDLFSNDPYTGTYFVNPNTSKNVMTGTFTDRGSTFQWFATQQ